MKSKSFPRRLRRASRTVPPTRARRKPAALNDPANSKASGARSLSVAIAIWLAADSGVSIMSKVTDAGLPSVLGHDE